MKINFKFLMIGLALVGATAAHADCTDPTVAEVCGTMGVEMGQYPMSGPCVTAVNEAFSADGYDIGLGVGPAMKVSDIATASGKSTSLVTAALQGAASLARFCYDLNSDWDITYSRENGGRGGCGN